MRAKLNRQRHAIKGIRRAMINHRRAILRGNPDVPVAGPEP